ncbi:hypothetical protein AN639_10855 [Candidatus Epulonipiscium fishelsonii]|uniref:Uncharacterized protein n=1 Tax=Candidatus Epulonipiscium fishelsonii TaxID=77094 RepID=A0ACC8XEB6_9FIRM|nr:hypothetical protein AN396_03655 [Epulopiscium sp. SCG-B11WGA-EpuloA1]ONI43231.1 hypothetical protein AN639_10855 [Epulopiscium sp. SCG-B05WGA-EpuloA1]
MIADGNSFTKEDEKYYILDKINTLVRNKVTTLIDELLTGMNTEWKKALRNSNNITPIFKFRIDCIDNIIDSVTKNIHLSIDCFKDDPQNHINADLIKKNDFLVLMLDTITKTIESIESDSTCNVRVKKRTR